MRINHLLTENCDIEKFDHTDDRGHPTYKEELQVSCKFLPYEERIARDENTSDNVKSGGMILSATDSNGNVITLDGKDRIKFSNVHYRIESLKFVKTIRAVLSHYELTVQVSEI